MQQTHFEVEDSGIAPSSWPDSSTGRGESSSPVQARIFQAFPDTT